jgi:uncharacterized protein (DUF2384 family)
MWTALWQELSDVSATLVGCDHVFGLLMRRGWPLAPLCLARIGSQSIALGAVHSINRAVSLSKATRRRKMAKSFSSEGRERVLKDKFIMRFN